MKTNSASFLMRGLKNYPLTKSQITKKLTKNTKKKIKIKKIRTFPSYVRPKKSPFSGII